jgi:hypothetical protein
VRALAATAAIAHGVRLLLALVGWAAAATVLESGSILLDGVAMAGCGWHVAAILRWAGAAGWSWLATSFAVAHLATAAVSALANGLFVAGATVTLSGGQSLRWLVSVIFVLQAALAAALIAGLGRTLARAAMQREA